MTSFVKIQWPINYSRNKTYLILCLGIRNAVTLYRMPTEYLYKATELNIKCSFTRDSTITTSQSFLITTTATTTTTTTRWCGQEASKQGMTLFLKVKIKLKYASAICKS